MRCSEDAPGNQLAQCLLMGLPGPRAGAAGSSIRLPVHRMSRSGVCGCVGVVMSEVVVQISADESRDSALLTKALDAFAKWSAEAGLSAESSDAPDIMMMTEYSQGQMRRKLVFQDRDHAARFLVFWRSEKQYVRMTEPLASPA